MSEDESKRFGHDEEQDEVEAHGHHKITATDEGGDTEDDDFEAHRSPKMNRPGKLQ